MYPLPLKATCTIAAQAYKRLYGNYLQITFLPIMQPPFYIQAMFKIHLGIAMTCKPHLDIKLKVIWWPYDLHLTNANIPTSKHIQTWDKLWLKVDICYTNIQYSQILLPGIAMTQRNMRFSFNRRICKPRDMFLMPNADYCKSSLWPACLWRESSTISAEL